MARSDKRERLIRSARALAHRKGFQQTTLAELAEETGILVGNIYYYFRTKDDLAAAMIEDHAAELRERFSAWEGELPDPRDRLKAFARLTAEAGGEIAEFGCPAGSLCQEMGKSSEALGRESSRLLDEMLRFAERQFSALGCGERSEALAVDYVAALQGGSLIAHSFRDPGVLERQMQRLEEWIDRAA